MEEARKMRFAAFEGENKAPNSKKNRNILV